MSDSNKWLINWFVQRGLPENVQAEKISELNYFQAGLLDSFGVIELIGAIEAEFNIQFTQDHFQDRRFGSITGLSEIIDELRAGGRR